MPHQQHPRGIGSPSSAAGSSSSPHPRESNNNMSVSGSGGGGDSSSPSSMNGGGGASFSSSSSLLNNSNNNFQQESSDNQRKKRVSFFSSFHSFHSIDESGLLSSISEDCEMSPTRFQLLPSSNSANNNSSSSTNNNNNNNNNNTNTTIGNSTNNNSSTSAVPSKSPKNENNQQNSAAATPSSSSSYDKKMKSLPSIDTSGGGMTHAHTISSFSDSTVATGSSSNASDNKSQQQPVAKRAIPPQPSPPISPTVHYLNYSDYAIKSLPSRNRSHSASLNNLLGFNFPLISKLPQSPTPTNTTPVNPYQSTSAITISHLSMTHNNNNNNPSEGNSSGSSGSSSNYSSGVFPPQISSSFSGNYSPFSAVQNSNSFGSGGGGGSSGGYNRNRGQSVHAGFQPPPLKRAQSVLHSNRLLASSFVRHNVDPKWDMRKDDCFGDDLNELDEESPQLPKRSPLLKQASVFAAASASFSINDPNRNSPRIILANPRDRALSVDLSSSLFDRVGNVLRERALVIQQKMNRDLRTFLWELKEVEFKCTELEQVEIITKEILASKTIDDLCKKDFMRELQSILQICVNNYTSLTHQSNSPSMHILSTTPTTPGSLIASTTAFGSGAMNIDVQSLGRQFEIMKQTKKLIFIYSRVNRVLELYKKHLADEELREREKEEVKQQRQRFKSMAAAVVDPESSKDRFDYDSSESQDLKTPKMPFLKPSDDEDTSSTSVSPRRSSVSSTSKHEHESTSDYDSPVSSPRTSISGAVGTPTSNNGSTNGTSAVSRTSKDIPSSLTPTTPISEKKKFSESFFSKFKTLFSKKEDPLLSANAGSTSGTTTPTTTTKSKSTNNTPTELKKQPKKEENVIEILCRICEELVPSTKLAEHSATCAVKHKIEMQNVSAFEKLKNIRRGIEKSIKKKKSTSLYKLFKLAKKAEKSSDRNQLQEIIGVLSTIIEEHNGDNFSGNNYRVSVYAKRLLDVIEGKCSALLHEEKQNLIKKMPKIKISDFEIIKPISRGAYGRVYLARKKSTRDIYAIKVIKKQYLYNHKNVGKTLTNEPDLLAERTIMKVLMENNEQSPFIVNFYYSFAGKRYLYIVMEYCPGGSLDCLLAEKLENGEGFDIDVVRHIAAESILALSDLHHSKIVHRDLKPDNMLIDKCGHLKLTDFGLSEIGVLDREDEQTSSSKQSMDALARQDELEEAEIQVRGTPDYLAPELLLGMPHTEAVDYWSLGCIVFELLFGCPPFNDDTPEYIFDNILSRRINWVDERLLPPEIVSSGVLNFVDRLLDPNPESRLNEITAKEHPFMIGVDWDKVLKEPVGVLPGVKDMTDTSKFKQREEAFPMHFNRESMETKSLSDIDDSSECLTEQTDLLGISVSVGRTPPLSSSHSMKDLRVAAGRSPPYQRSSSFHSTSTGTPPAIGSMTQTDASMASPSNHHLLGTSALDSFSFPEHVNTSALLRLNEEMIRQSQAGLPIPQQQRNSEPQDANNGILLAASSINSSGGIGGGGSGSSNNSNTSLAF